MQAFTQVDAVAAPLARSNVDTDQIVPALYLQKPLPVP
jgi:3-isopropylmalate/(R)-2-methylmalate dehydratase small subunit